MGKGGRVFCIFTPYVLTIASLVCIIMVGLGCTNSDSNTLNDLYFFRVCDHLQPNRNNTNDNRPTCKTSPALQVRNRKYRPLSAVPTSTSPAPTSTPS